MATDPIQSAVVGIVVCVRGGDGGVVVGTVQCVRQGVIFLPTALANCISLQ